MYDSLFFQKPIEYKGAYYSVRDFMGFCACLFIDVSDRAYGNPEVVKQAERWREAYYELDRLNDLLIYAI